MLECKICRNEGLQVKRNLVLCLTCLPESKQVYHNLYCKVTKYGFTAESLVSLWLSQQQKCAICRSFVPLFEMCVDHDHISNKVRGLLCRTCNIGLPYNVNLPGLIRYLEEFKSGSRGKVRPHPERGPKADLSKKEKIKARKYLPDQCEACLATESDHFTESFIVDHCHITGVIRGHLCGTCNKCIGMFKDSVCRIKQALVYLNGEKKEQPCVEPDLKWPVVVLENAEELKIARTRKKAKLTPDKVRQVRVWLKEKVPKLQIANRLDVDSGTITAIQTGKTWKHVE